MSGIFDEDLFLKGSQELTYAGHVDQHLIGLT